MSVFAAPLFSEDERCFNADDVFW